MERRQQRGDWFRHLAQGRRGAVDADRSRRRQRDDVYKPDRAGRDHLPLYDPRPHQWRRVRVVRRAGCHHAACSVTGLRREQGVRFALEVGEGMNLSREVDHGILTSHGIRISLHATALS